MALGEPRHPPGPYERRIHLSPRGSQPPGGHVGPRNTGLPVGNAGFLYESMAFSSLEGYMEACMCGVFGVYGHSEAAKLTYLGLHALQHRGQESAGIISTDGRRLYAHRAMGLVHDTFTPADLAGLPGSASIGHVRYSTAGGSHIRNAQPLAVDYARGSIAIAHNGNLTNAEELREKLEARG